MKSSSAHFRSTFSRIAGKRQFMQEHGGWFLAVPTGLVVLCLQRSSYGAHLTLILKAYLNGLFSESYRPEKMLVSSALGDIFVAAPDQFSRLLDLEIESDEEILTRGLEELFGEFIDPVVHGLSSLRGIQELSSEGKIHLLPAVREFVLRRTN